MNGLGRKKQTEEKKQPIFTKETLGVVLTLFATLSLVCLITRESVFSLPGKFVNSFLHGCFGYFAYAVVAWCVIIGVRLLFDKKSRFSIKERALLTLGFLLVALVTHIATMHGVELSYGEYIKTAYLMALDGGIATCSGGGLFVAIIAYPFTILMTEVGCYVIFGVAVVTTVYFAVKTYLARNKSPKQVEKDAFRSSFVKTENISLQPEQNQTKSEFVATDKPVKQSLFINNPDDFALKSKHELKKDDGPSMKLGFSEGGLGVVTTSNDKTSQKIGEDMQKKIEYIKMPAVLDVDALRENVRLSSETSNRYTRQNPVQENQYGTNSESYTSVSDYVNSSVESNSLDNDVQDIPFIEHEENITVEGDDVATRADNFEKRYAQNPEFVPEQPLVDDTEVFRTIPSREQPVQEEKVEQEIPVIEEQPIVDEMETTIEEQSAEEINPSILRSEDRVRRIFDQEIEEKPVTEEKTEEKTEQSPSVSTGFTSRAEADGNATGGLGERRRFDFGRSVSEQPEPAPEPEKPKKPAPPINRKYFRPPLDLLETYTPPVNAQKENHEERMEIIKSTLEQFHINAIPQSFVQGPAITRYEIMMPAGVSVKKVLGLDADLKMRLAAKDGVRIEAPIPGKNLVGIEVANNVRTTVGLREILEGVAGQKVKDGSLMFALGKDLVGKPVVDDLAKGPHYLVAGATGSGKSVCLNLMIVSLIMRYSPEDLRLILVDPKGVEFINYEHIPHLMIDEIITEPKKALAVLTWAYAEMERRFAVFRESGGGLVVDIDSYNSTVASATVAKMPRIVIIIDELADLMETCKKDLESHIRAIAQKARAAGIHLVLATQRPSVDIITGTIKANLPSRIAFKVMNFNDSQTILSEAGAEKLLGNGDMLYKTARMPATERYQGAYISSREVNIVVNYVKEHNQAYFDDELKEYLDKETRPKQEDTVMEGGDEGGDANEINEFFLKALWLAVNTQTVSISQLQRRFQIGYSRAGGLVDKMERMGFVSPNEGSKARKVLLSREEFENRFGAMPD